MIYIKSLLNKPLYHILLIFIDYLYLLIICICWLFYWFIYYFIGLLIYCLIWIVFRK